MTTGNTDQSTEKGVSNSESGSSQTTKRGFMQMAGATGLGLLLGGATAPAAADATDRQEGNDSNGNGNAVVDRDDDGLLETPQKDGFSVSEYEALVDEESKRWNVADRRITTRERRHIYVDPDGDDGNDGSEGSPLATLQEAFNRLPFFVNHRTVIHINKGVNTNDACCPNSARNIVNHLKGENLIIRGDPDNPEDHVIGRQGGGEDANPHWTALAFMSDPLSCTIEGVTFNTQVQPYAATLWFENCIFNSSPEPYISNAVGGYSSLVTLRNCEIGGDSDYVFSADQFNTMNIQNCTGKVNKTIVHSWNSGGLVRDLGGNDIEAPEGWINNEDASVITVRGHAEIGAKVAEGQMWRQEEPIDEGDYQEGL